jgi:predicted transposase YdaD
MKKREGWIKGEMEGKAGRKTQSGEDIERRALELRRYREKVRILNGETEG